MTDSVRHAESYPFAIPDRSFLFDDGRASPAPARPEDRAGRRPVLAAGSNQSPDQLARKYAGFAPGAARIPADRATLRDFDVVYAAHLARYGSIPATLQAAPGAAVTVFVLWLDDLQLARMHETEANYSFDRLRGLSLALDEGGALETAFAYSAKAGCFNHEGGCAALAEIAAENRRFPALSQKEALARLRDRLAPGCGLDRFVRAHVEDAEVRRARARALARDALPPAYPREVVDALGG